MSYEHGTTHYNLPLTSGEDPRDWFDTNQSFEDVDAALWAAKQDAEGAKEDLTSVKEDVASLQTEAAAEKTRLDTVISDVSALSTVVIQQGTDIGDAKQDLEDMICPTQESSATASVEHAQGSYFIYNDTLYVADELITVGTLIVPDSNCHTTSVTDVLATPSGEVIDTTARAGVAANSAKIGTLSDLNTTAKSDLVAAINEVYALAQAAGVTSVALRSTASIPDYGSSGRDIVIDFSSTFTTLVSCAPAVKISGQYCTIRSQTVDTVAKTCTVHVTNSSDASQSCTIEVTGFGIV